MALIATVITTAHVSTKGEDSIGRRSVPAEVKEWRPAAGTVVETLIKSHGLKGRGVAPLRGTGPADRAGRASASPVRPRERPCFGREKTIQLSKTKSALSRPDSPLAALILQMLL